MTVPPAWVFKASKRLMGAPHGGVGHYLRVKVALGLLALTRRAGLWREGVYVKRNGLS